MRKALRLIFKVWQSKWNVQLQAALTYKCQLRWRDVINESWRWYRTSSGYNISARRILQSTYYFDEICSEASAIFSSPQRFIPMWPRCTLAMGFDIPGFIVCQVLISHCLMWQSTNKLLTPQMNTFSTKGTRHMEDILMQIVLMVKHGYLNRYKWCILNRFSPLRHKAGATIMTDYGKWYKLNIILYISPNPM